jgi:epoxide hydrolase-like predicted phosphatase
LPSIRAVLFDFGGVFTASPFGALESLGEKLGTNPELLMEVVFGPYHEDTDHPWHRLERGEITLVAAREEILALGAERGIEADPLRIFGALGGSAARTTLIARVRELRGAGLRTAMITNNAHEFREAWRRMIPVDELFELVVDSSEVGIRKPDPRIFQLTLERLGGIAPEEALFLDDYASNVEAAEGLGIRGVLVEPDPSAALAALDALLQEA